MSSDIISLVRQSSKIFVWVCISSDHAAYLQASKKTVLEYLESISVSGMESFHIELNDFGEVFLGKPPEDTNSV